MTAVLADTSVWVAHFRNRNAALVSLLTRNQILIHPFVIGEIACGTPPGPRAATLAHLSLLPAAQLASFSETMAWIERDALYGLGCGWIDITLLASTLMTPGALLWTLDRRLVSLAARHGVGYP